MSRPKIDEIITKKIAFLASLILLPFTYWINVPSVCSANEQCFNFLAAFTVFVFYFSIPILFFSSILFFFRDEVYELWLKLTVAWIPVMVLVLFFSPNSTGGGWGMASISDRAVVAFFAYALYFLLSILVILFKFIQMRRKKS